MNKYQDALNNIVKSSCPTRENGCCNCEMQNICNCDAKDWIKTIQELVDRDTPTKPMKHYISIPALGECIVETYDAERCPKCGNIVCNDYYSEDKQQFCSKCGQAILWED